MRANKDPGFPQTTPRNSFIAVFFCVSVALGFTFGVWLFLVLMLIMITMLLCEKPPS